MDHRGWPWKKKSSNKTGILKALNAADPASSSLAKTASLEDQGSKKVSYVQVPLDSYTHLTGLEDEVKNWQTQVKDLEEQLSAAKLEITAKDNLVIQHSKVAEEAVSGWEKADSKASALKNQLESVSILKLTAEDRASHLDGALKECLMKLRVAKEEHHEKMNEVVLIKNRQCDQIKTELEAKITQSEQRLLKSASEYAILSRALQENSNMLMEINDAKSQVEVENELLRRDIQSREKEISSLKYEVHVVSKELDIRNEEKNMSVRSAEAANKQYLDSAKKIAKLEAECQRLRVLVKKKLPGPAALAQMKLEVENWAHEFVEPQSIPNKPSGRNSKLHSPTLPDIQVRSDHKETELRMERLLDMEEEMKMLREALAMRTSELQSSRDLCAKMVDRIKNLETQVQILSQRKNSPRSIFGGASSGSSPNGSDPQSVTSLCEDGFGGDGKYSALRTISDLSSDIKKDKIRSRSKNSITDSSIDLMDDFLEMERIAHTKKNSETSLNISSSYQMNAETVKDDASFNPSNNEVPFSSKEFETSFEPNLNQLSSMLLSRIFVVLGSQNKDTDLQQVLEDVVKSTMADLGSTLAFNSSVSCTERPPRSGMSSSQTCVEGTIETKTLSPEHSKLATDAEHEHLGDQDMVDTVCGVSKFLMCLKSIIMSAHDSSKVGHGLVKEYEDLSASLDKFLSGEYGVLDLFLSLSRILALISDLELIVSPKSQELDCPGYYKQSNPDGCIDIPHSDANHKVPIAGDLASLNVASCKCSLEIEQLKVEKDDMAKERAILSQDIESKRLQLEEFDSQLMEARSELASSRKWNGLAETQLKCMAESYKLLETRAQELEANVKILQEKLECLDDVLEDERCGHREALTRIKDLQEQIHRRESCQACSSLAADFDVESKKEREIEDAAAKLAECQETIFLLGKQLKALHQPRKILNESQHKEKLQTNETSTKHELARSFQYPQSKGCSSDFENTEMERASSFDMRVLDESPLPSYDSSSSPSSGELFQRVNKPIFASSTSGLMSEKNQNGSTRFFPLKGKH